MKDLYTEVSDFIELVESRLNKMEQQDPQRHILYVDGATGVLEALQYVLKTWDEQQSIELEEMAQYYHED